MTDITPPNPQSVPAGWYADGNSPQRRWWNGQEWMDAWEPAPQVVPVAGYRKQYKTSHGFHLIMTILTLGLWGLFVWLPIGIINAARS